jgi:hypothetical protein
MPDKGPRFADDVVTFESVAEMRAFMKRLHDHYMKEMDRLGHEAGVLMRDRLKAEGNAVPTDAAAKARNPDWRKMGTIWINVSDAALGLNDVTLKVLGNYKAKLSGTADALRSFEEFKQFIVAPGSSFVLYLKEGVPERIIVVKPEVKTEPATVRA